MKKIFEYKIVAAVLFIFLFFLSSFQDKNTIAWNEERPLTWDDFNGKPQPRFAAASTSYDILTSVSKGNGDISLVKIEAVFFKNKSWKKSSWINDEVLSHEQKHFDIVELFARKLRKKIAEIKFSTHNEIDGRLKQLYDANDVEMDKFQDQYDEETDGSMNGDQQRAWQKKITNEIKGLDDFKSPVVKINVQG